MVIYKKTEAAKTDLFYKTVVLTISDESKEVSCSFSRTLEKSFGASSLLI